ncbi:MULTISPECIES: ABC-2 transporter permease [unclassified Clostridioides]|uniref:ABC-2 transporter permease n=1 Tax=unclassified Clostridioides TaxID=2635829 RepID=UPI001D0C5D03|nr:ABC-2 transporter permease [Clostridioides sp. ES-S-0123-01]MCC0678656.1 ABC-2 transporter permease [Clostridioides sp. ES-S-0005-03]MCC0693962.1 ABC-2 transporter permease [Clostridioides sp. ES-S-0048-02]MCC0704986.1 ABC-2 transporter permease [Clostridioides sp. ES-S-0049-02]MCC0708463.1 ABC-2 transporter permease [Clostridioides sp. ES-S-0190-01]MCC0762950.1 ABC-2 transporter permease [Clostridioides sp. ES-S-0006-03]UDN48478.1 ABC-2 transporter permease [Clostridioides sp. ES-S-0173-0
MFNLIRKDLIVGVSSDGIRNLKYILLFFIFYFFLNSISYYTVSVVISYLIFVNTFECDYESDSRIFIRSMPVSIEDIVYSKYLLGVGLIIFITTIASLISKLTSLVFFRSMVLNDVFFSINIFLAILSIVLPLFFKFGYGKMKICGLIISILVYFVYGSILRMVSMIVYQVKHVNYSKVGGVYLSNYITDMTNTRYINLYSITFLTIMIFIISMYFSIKISKKNKFNYKSF